MAARPGEVIREVRIEAAPEDVFPYFTDPGKLVSWKAIAAESDARPGGRFRLDITGRGDVAWGEYLEIDPPHRLIFSWHWENAQAHGQPPPVPSVVEVTLTPEGSGTLLRLVHRGIPGASRDGSAAGWTHYLARLVQAAAGHDPGPDPWARKPAGISDSATPGRIHDGHSAQQG
jgi:uncharacterized protein YndB with AHSA1/START domain